MEFILKPTGDCTDRAAQIMELLEQYRTCVLTPGTYYVSGIKMPDGTSLYGMGEGSRIVLLEEIAEGCAVAMASHCTVKELTLIGCEADMPRPTEVGTRHGIGFIGTATPENRSGQPMDSIISGCRIRNFSGGGITCRDTGYNINCSVSVTDCRIHNCGAGINISHFSEFHNFTNVTSTRNLYGCINNGGNNVFVGCGFDGNTVGYLIDNSRKQSNNNAHGSCVACTFNHTDFNKGVGIRILGSKPGYVFSDCQMFFSNADIQDSVGIQFNNFNFGKAVQFHVTGNSTVKIDGGFFSSQPEFQLEGEPQVRVLDCKTKAGEAVEL
ncbi:MAG: hypothetical protein J6Q54_05810 [Oscillospiraceae bacterium]|nr:hypothetical protein [Oscillospiraceae bacterium]